MTTKFVEEQKAWIEKNPVRFFRKSVGMSIFTCASALGVTTTSVQQWEAGSSTPTDENMAKIAKLTGNENVAAEWKEWSNSRPTL